MFSIIKVSLHFYLITYGYNSYLIAKKFYDDLYIKSQVLKSVCVCVCVCVCNTRLAVLALIFVTKFDGTASLF